MPTTKEKDPNAGQGVEVSDPSKGNQLVNTLTHTPDALPVKDRQTLGRNRAPFTAEETAFAKQEGISRLEVRYILSKKPRDEDFVTPDGDTFRSAGDLYIRTCRDGVRRFTAYMNEGSVQHDFRYFDRVVADAMSGRMDGWVRHTFKDGDEGWAYEYPNYQIDHIKEVKPACVIVEEESEAAMLVGFGSEWGYPCEEPRCREEYHEHDAVNHSLEVLENQLTERGGYEIEICKDIKYPELGWVLNVWTGPDLTELTPEQVATFANDLQWMGIECATTNAKERTLRRPVGTDDHLREIDG
ncbi:hypothetical protein ACIP5T_17200 [Microbacterium sp. NPDC088619]|uniref:hypothetical protein n=1 Tax=Microbacterium sp. NPDC088619 TaxID=3364196 RepID=UPI0037F86B01